MKKTIIFLLSALLVSPCYAEDTMSVDVKVEDDIVLGTVLVPDAKVSDELRVQIRDEEGNLEFFDIIYTNEDREASFKYYSLGTTGEYTVDVYSEKRDENAGTTFDFYDSAYRSTVISEFNKIREENKSFSEFVEKYDGILDVCQSYAKILSKSDLDTLFNAQNIKAESISDINDAVYDYTLLVCVNQTNDAGQIKELLDGEFKDCMEFIKDEEDKPL